MFNTRTDMTAVAAAPKAHKIGKPVMLTQADISKRRAEIERKYGTLEELKKRKELYVLSPDEFWALEDLRWLAGE